MADDRRAERQVRQVISAYDGRLPAHELAAMLLQAKSGEARTAIAELGEALARHQLALTPGDRRVLIELLGHFGVSTEAVEILPGIEGAEDIDVGQFARRTHAVVERLAPKLKPEWSRSIAEFDQVGDWGLAVTELAAALAVEQVAVTAADRDELRTLIASLPASTGDIDLLNVAAEG